MKGNIDDSFDFVKTKNSEGNENGWVIGVCKDGEKLLAYQTVLYPTLDKDVPTMKGYHAYHRQTNRLTCTSGFVTVRVFWDGKEKTDYKLAEHHPAVLTIPPENPFAILNYTGEFARVMNHPLPLWSKEGFETDQYRWEPTEIQEKQNGRIIDMSDFVSTTPKLESMPESELPQTIDHP